MLLFSWVRKMNKILIIEDDKNIQRLLTLELRHKNYSVDSAYDGEQGIEMFSKNSYDLVLLDLMLPKKSGKEVCQELRKLAETPIIIITAKDSVLDKVELLDLGANDYICKPFAMEELLARIRVATRNKENSNNKQFYLENEIKMDILAKKVFLNEVEVSLTKTEFLILEYFMKNKGLSCSREKIIIGVWGYDFDGEEKIVDVYINSLRKKIDPKSYYIHTIRGFGYIFQYKED
ncbi:DNA-binding response regulator [Fusobacterium nucleatum subsp. nucleatum ATCC 25586]|uniref:DNA-binding response regulator n=3 Tax=Fusobacterium nucleatum subsp. nucleatum TaxID=76856 RepID=Q8RE63_FUSNN|nr:Two-component response regulator [Fusobacterium nucleatum subsp. nucleatum ATCC 25586]AVQ15586.1 DNA-binding response regulator [Fusobacterium nucleatum subsp. nucleatum ATCC 25586]AVQ23133.1 DNA-binding response regulator [Fusobacterium nucleatum subsp. nucleatum ATCC 23726]EFG95969.1 response regulator receiver domain protein [Fusobacterium nucleatum subsp. nucleatum ATCC 23726]